MGRRGGSFARALLLARKVNFLFFSFFHFFLLFYLFYCSKFELRTPWFFLSYSWLFLVSLAFFSFSSFSGQVQLDVPLFGHLQRTRVNSCLRHSLRKIQL
jgi:hypothetical protein